MSVNSTRSLLYRIARLLGDVQAVSSGSPSKMVKRAGRKAAGRGFGSVMGRLFR